MKQQFKTACTHTGVRATVPLIMGRSHELLPTPVWSVSWRSDAYLPERIFVPVRDI
jgi:hypothetical protein